MQTGQTLGERVKMLEAGCVVKDAEIRRLHAEVARLEGELAENARLRRKLADARAACQMTRGSKVALEKALAPD